jgi:membrane protein
MAMVLHLRNKGRVLEERKAKLKGWLSLLGNSFQRLKNNDPLRMAGATAFFATFALAPILVILIQVLRLILDPVLIRAQLFNSLSNIVGPEAVRQLTLILTGLKNLAHNWYITIGGFIFLLFISTTLFRIIKDSLNQLWKVKPHYGKRMEKARPRLQAILVILFAGILFAIGIFAEGLQVIIKDFISEVSPILSGYFNRLVNLILSLLFVTLWFAMVFRYLPDARPVWKVALAGGLFTAVLFTFGKIFLRWMLSYSNINTLYGTSASIVLLLLFIFYSSLIFYFGGAFTKEYSIHINEPIQPLGHARNYRLVEEDEENV